MKNKKIMGLFFSVLLTGCSSLQTDVSNTDAQTKTAPVGQSVETKNKMGFVHTQSKNLKITDNVYFLNKINKGAIPLMDSPVTLIFIEEDGLKNVAKGYSGCNDYYFKYQVSNNIFVLGEIVTTNFKCGKQEARFENFLFKELNKNPKIKINDDYVVIKGYDTELLWKKKEKDPKSARKVISSTPKNTKEKELVAYVELSHKTPSHREPNKKSKTEKPKKYVNEHEGVLVTSENIKGLHIYKRSLSKAENAAIRKKAVVIRNKLKSRNRQTRIMNLNLKNGDTIPLIEYKVKRNDTLKKIIMTTYPVGTKLDWLALIGRLNQVASLNTKIKNIDSIYPHQKVYIPVFVN